MLHGIQMFVRLLPFEYISVSASLTLIIWRPVGAWSMHGGVLFSD